VRIYDTSANDVSKMSAAAISYENVFSYIECVLSLYIGGQRRVKDVSSSDII